MGASPFLQETLTYASPLITNQLVPSPTSARETPGSVGAPLITEMSAHCTLVYIWNVKKGKVSVTHGRSYSLIVYTFLVSN